MSSKTNDLRKVIQTKLVSLKSTYAIKDVFYHEAETDKMYPHIVYDFESVNLDGINRNDLILTVDIFDSETKRIENIADDVEELFHMSNFPQNTILPTFFLESRRNLPDEDKNIRHILVRFTIQNYER